MDEMVDGFHSLLTKGTKSTIWPHALSKSIGRPNPVLDGKPNMMFDLGSRPNLPHKGHLYWK
jgi:hypothetical protein